MTHHAVNRLFAVVMLFCSVAIFSACSNGNKASSYNPDTGHANGWSDPASHGAFAKSEAAGFESCRSCHGKDFSGGISDTSCYTCHQVKAPHAPAPWRGGNRTHTNTNRKNAAVCALCHTGGANSTVKPNPPAATGTEPGCFNNTLCHAAPGHAAGWSDPSVHGAAAKSKPDGFLSCEACHGTDFSGGEAKLSCFNCHGVNAPHAAAPWRDGARTHTDTDPGNATVCAQCHLNGTNSSVKPNSPAAAGTQPGCFNSTLCHATAGHPAGWSDPSQHGATAEQNFGVCKTCHGANYKGGAAATTCYDCHSGPGLNHPAPAWVVADHKTSAASDITVCQKCHGTDYLGGGSHIACTSCHMEKQTKVHLLAWYPDVQANHGAYAVANGTATCATVYCHGTNLTGVASSGPSCSTCHTWPYAGAHPTGWSSPSVHGVTAEQDFSVCKTCHGANFKGGAATTTCYDCHNGPGLNHPAPAWVVADHKTSAAADITVCQKCHGADYLGGGAHIACNSCHMENQTKVHLLAWYPDVRTNHRAFALANGTAACSNAYCHGTNLAGVALSGPSCSTCHTWPFTSAACGSCHGIPPDGTADPNVAGAHTAHAALSPSITCGTCHAGAGSGTTLHQDGTVEVVIDGAYNAKAGAASFNTTAKTCSNVSCHGGPRTQTSTQAGSRLSTASSTPNWLTGSIDVNTQCVSCHVYGTGSAAPENDSYYSGQHYRHVYSQGKACTVCHDTAKLATGHFTSLSTPISAGAASATLKTAIRYNGVSCNPSSGGLTGCHSSENW